jgi:hypothetical protein
MNKRLFGILLIFTGGLVADASPNCGQTGGGSLQCGSTCEYSQTLGAGNGGGYCLERGTKDGTYCYSESRPTNSEGGYSFACFDGAYEACCDPTYPYPL